MKSLKSILVACLFAGLFVTSASAQDKANKVTQGWKTGIYWSPVFCDGEMVDMLESGTLRIHYVWRWEPGVIYKEIDQLKGEVQSSKTGEIFKIRETDKYLGTPNFFIVTWRYNLIGNMGSHYHGTITMDMISGDIIEISNTVCNQAFYYSQGEGANRWSQFQKFVAIKSTDKPEIYYYDDNGNPVFGEWFLKDGASVGWYYFWPDRAMVQVVNTGNIPEGFLRTYKGPLGPEIEKYRKR